MATKTELRAKTLEAYESVIEKNIVRHIGSVTLGSLKPGHIRECLAAVGAKSRALRRKVFDLLNAPLERAVRDELIEKNPCWKVDAPTVDTGTAEAIDAADLPLILERIAKDRLEAL